MPDTVSPRRIVVICGPTGIGKTRIAIELAVALAGQIVGADSMQVYRYMDIGTAKPTAQERATVPHHMIDVVDPDEPFDAARYAALARQVLDWLHRQRVVPVVAGGTGLYIKALLHGLCDAPRPDPALRHRLATEARDLGPQALHRRLADLDAAAAERIHPNDALRITRALEVTAATGRALSVRQAEHGFNDEPFEVFPIGLTMERASLYERINRRVEAMIAQGLLEEVRLLLERGYGPELNSMRAIGYRHMVDHIEARTDWQETVRLMKRDTRRFAKRQFTWFKADPSIRWIEPNAFADMLPRIRSFLAQGF